jgi:hypothetical protein
MKNRKTTHHRGAAGCGIFSLAAPAGAPGGGEGGTGFRLKIPLKTRLFNSATIK